MRFYDDKHGNELDSLLHRCQIETCFPLSLDSFKNDNKILFVVESRVWCDITDLTFCWLKSNRRYQLVWVIAMNWCSVENAYLRLINKRHSTKRWSKPNDKIYYSFIFEERNRWPAPCSCYQFLIQNICFAENDHILINDKLKKLSAGEERNRNPSHSLEIYYVFGLK